MPVLDKQQIRSGRSWKLKSQFLQPLGDERMGRMEDSRGKTKGGQKEKGREEGKRKERKLVGLNPLLMKVELNRCFHQMD